MKGLKQILSSLLVVTSVFTVASCSLFKKHTHEWQNYVVKNPTCTENGLLEKLCSDCGEKEYEDIMAKGHTIINGICTVCGQQGTSDYEISPIAMPEGANNSAAWSMEKIYQEAKKIGYQEDYKTFLSQLSTGHLQAVYIDALGLFHTTGVAVDKQGNNLELPIILTIGKVSPVNSKETKLGNIYTVQIQDQQLIFTYSDGVMIPAGKLQGSGVTITSFGINTENELVVYYSDNTIAFAGKVPEGKVAENQANFIYQRAESGYYIYKVLNSGDKVIEIPVSHQGIPVVHLCANALKYLTDPLDAIVVPSTVTSFGDNCFKGLSYNTKVFFEMERNSSMLANSGLSNAHYFKGEWSYINGVPTPNN